ncbi:hypothetical protein lerEdw1_003324 [Lerista edwardsae]|nr:hypothetical protein lerEdw1_003324 [Lerista edwardsae]
MRPEGENSAQAGKTLGSSSDLISLVIPPCFPCSELPRKLELGDETRLVLPQVANFLQKVCGTNYPLSIAFIVVNEFCERFSYYGMKAVLTLYFLYFLHWDENTSTAVYHAFSSLCYFTPVIGALMADSWLGKYKTIIYLSIVYVIGHVIKSVGAIPSVGNQIVHV